MHCTSHSFESSHSPHSLPFYLFHSFNASHIRFCVCLQRKVSVSIASNSQSVRPVLSMVVMVLWLFLSFVSSIFILSFVFCLHFAFLIRIRLSSHAWRNADYTRTRDKCGCRQHKCIWMCVDRMSTAHTQCKCYGICRFVDTSKSKQTATAAAYPVVRLPLMQLYLNRISFDLGINSSCCQ